LRNAVVNWLVTNSQPFNSANGKGFLHMINKFDPAFHPPCYVTIKKDIGCDYQTAFQAIKEMIIQTCETTAITTDFWTSCAKSGYIGITCHWLSEKRSCMIYYYALSQLNIHILEIIFIKLL
jgi:hypothetical protein